jgi:DNA-binding SARP family transcriptional activator
VWRVAQLPWLIGALVGGRRRADALALTASRDPIPGCQPADSTERLELRLLGRLRASSRGETLVHWPCRKGKFLLAYLALSRERRPSRDLLMETFWPRSDPRAARNCLNVTLHALRQHLRDLVPQREVIVYDCEGYSLNPELGIWIDVEEFEGAWKRGQSLERADRAREALAAYSLAASLYVGDLLEDDLYDPWLDLEREHLKEVYLALLDRISRHCSLDGDPEGAIRLCEQMLEKDGCQESVHRRLMLCYLKLGLRDRALRQYARCVEVLRRDLNVEPTAETEHLRDEIKRSR